MNLFPTKLEFIFDFRSCGFGGMGNDSSSRQFAELQRRDSVVIRSIDFPSDLLDSRNLILANEVVCKHLLLLWFWLSWNSLRNVAVIMHVFQRWNSIFFFASAYACACVYVCVSNSVWTRTLYLLVDQYIQFHANIFFSSLCFGRGAKKLFNHWVDKLKHIFMPCVHC